MQGVRPSGPPKVTSVLPAPAEIVPKAAPEDAYTWTFAMGRAGHARSGVPRELPAALGRSERDPRRSAGRLCNVAP